MILASFEYLAVQGIRLGEYYGLILLGAVGMMLMSSAVELVLIFIALEISSISTYILAGFRRHSAASAESSLKYFLLGSFATAFFLYGVALMFGATGSTSIYPIAASLRAGTSTLAYAGVALMFVGLGFKVASAPFHVWTPDVYEGAPAPVVALMSTAPKAAAFAVLLRILFAAAAPGWFWIVWCSAALSMTIGNIGALVQTNIKRMLAYSSIAHAGYLLCAFAAAQDHRHLGGHLLRRRLRSDERGRIHRDRALRQAERALRQRGRLRRAGPPRARSGRRAHGLPAVADWNPHHRRVLRQVLRVQRGAESDLVGLTIIGVLNSAIASYYYLRVIVVMYMREPKEDTPMVPMPFALGVSLTAAVVVTIYLGVLPGRVLNYALQGARDLVR